MTTQTNRIKIEDADTKTLHHFAEVILGLEVKTGTNATQLRAKIKQAGWDQDTIPAPPPAPEPIVQQAPAAPAQQIVYVTQPAQSDPDLPKPSPAAVERPASVALMHPSRDPKVELTIQKTDDKRRAKDVSIGVNGDIFRMQRGERAAVPYRVYLALENAKEKAAVDHPTEVNKITGEPIKVWEEVYSYPFNVHKMPSDEEIAAWEAATGSGFKNAA